MSFDVGAGNAALGTVLTIPDANTIQWIQCHSDRHARPVVHFRGGAVAQEPLYQA